MGIVADCSNLKLTTWPFFNSSVKAIDLSQNQLDSSSPCQKCLPVGLLHLNISRNNFSSFRAISWQRFSNLVSLNLSYNPFILNESAFPPKIFRKLKHLQLLDLKRNSSDKDLFYKNEYPSAAISMLQSLQYLRMDGLFNRTFNSIFSNLKSLSRLDLSGLSGYCEIRSIGRYFFKYLPNLSHVDLSACKLRSIEQNALSNLKFLEDLNLSFNDELTFRVLENITFDLAFTPIRILNLQKLHCSYGMGTKVTIQGIKHLRNTLLEELNIADNRIELFEFHAIGYLPKSLKRLTMSWNRFTVGLYIIEFSALKNLTFLDVSHNFMTDADARYEKYLDFYCDDSRNEIEILQNRDPHNKLEKEHMTLLKILNGIRAIPMPPNLETIDVRNSMLGIMIKNWSFTENRIKTIHLQNNYFSIWEGPFSGLNSLRFVNLSNNGCTYMSSAVLTNFSTVEKIFVANNFLGGSLRNDSFSNTNKLTVLDLTNNRIKYLPLQIFSSMKELRHLNLSINALSNFDFRMHHMKNLESLDLSVNQVYSISKFGRNQIDAILRKKKEPLKINLLQNPLMCVCETLSSLEWMYKRIQDESVQFVDIEKYSCFDYSHDVVYNFTDFQHVLEQLNKRCSSYPGVISGAVSFITAFLILVVGRIVYRYRWRIRYLFYIMKSRLHGYKSLVKTQTRYQYDAFVSYAAEDLPFVKNELIKELEGNGGFTLCLHNRDFLPGFEIAENIVAAINKSRKTVVVLSPDYINSYWCMFELNVARMESIYSREDENILFLIMYKHIGSGDKCIDIPAILLDLIEKKSYLEFPKETSEREFFWTNIRDTLGLEI
jgi:Leucine-rich repeat (LRR) protein